ncbi:MAG TPA: AAA family ATPase [Pirellulaceae bacterium]|nr:AAA family ATPase [Pirellulaceae bacterium]
MLIRDLTIENYRSFEKYKLDGLARVNLLVGDNNCGKTSVLEAAYLLETNGADDSIWKLLQSRGEIGFVYEGVTQTDPVFVVPVSELFRGFTIAGKRIPRLTIKSDGYGEVRLTLGSKDEVIQEIDRDRADFGSLFDQIAGNTGTLRTSESGVLYTRFMGTDGCCMRIQHVTTNGGLRRQTSGESVGSSISTSHCVEKPIAEYLPIAHANAETLKADWVRVLQNQRDANVIDALRIVQPEVNEVLVLPTPMSPPQARSHVLVRANGSNYPLSRLGEGANRLLMLGMLLANAAGGFLLVDEIDTGLHYSKLSDMWRMVINAATRLNVQVFATSHSLDCLNSLSDCLQRDPSLAEYVAVHRIERAIDEAVTLTGSEFVDVHALNSEVR